MTIILLNDYLAHINKMLVKMYIIDFETSRVDFLSMGIFL